MGETRDGVDGSPDAARFPPAQQRRDDRVDGVAIAVDGMPHGHQYTRFSEQQKQDSVEDGEGLLEEKLGRGMTATLPQRSQQQFERVENSGGEGAADRDSVASGR